MSSTPIFSVERIFVDVLNSYLLTDSHGVVVNLTSVQRIDLHMPFQFKIGLDPRTKFYPLLCQIGGLDMV